MNLSNISQKNKEHLFAEIIQASSHDLEQRVDHVQVLTTIAKCLDDLIEPAA